MGQYDDFEPGDPKAPWNEGKATKAPPTLWYRLKPKDSTRGGNISGLVQHLINQDRYRLDRYERYFRLYGGNRLLGIRPWESPLTVTGYATMANRTIEDALRLNVVKASIDTITSKVGKLRPRPTFVTDGGDYALQLRAKKLQQFMDGAYHQSDSHELGADIFRDAMVFGTGVLHPYREFGDDGEPRLCAERVPVWELLVDPADAIYGTPRCIYRTRWVSLDLARILWPRLANLGVPSDGVDAEASQAYRAGYVRVIEAWCKSVPGKECGAYSIVVGGYEADFDEWEYDEFPFVMCHWSKPIQGFWGDSAIREVVGIQVEVNKLIQSVQDAMSKVGQPWVLRKEGAVLRPDKLDNIAASVITVEAATPMSDAVQVVTFQPVHPQVLAHIENLYQKAFQILGSNQLAASATAPAGLESGRALEALSEEHSERFMTVSRHFEHVMGKLLARQFIRLAKELDEELKEAGKGGFKLRAPGKGRQSVILKWADVAIDEDGYLIQVWPESVLPTTPAARSQHVQQLADAGWVDRDEARRLLNFPDLAAEDDLNSADIDNLHRQLADMLEEGKSVMPEPYQNLHRALVTAQQAVLRASADRAPEAHIDLVRDYISAVEALIQRAEASQQPQQAAAPEAAMPQMKAAMPSMAGAPMMPG